ncbi:acyl-CoA dehydrogenase family protein [Rhizocola hellebori]|nr:acyl-CoA dehydrogenase family protein [Rhizocola hellebori]
MKPALISDDTRPRVEPAGLSACFEAIWPDVSGLLPPEAVAAVAAGAATADSEGRPCRDSLEVLRALGWPGLPVPVKLLGGGASLAQCCAAQRALGAADPALAIALNMHLFSVGLMVEHWKRRADVSWLLLEAIASQGRIVASAFAEPHLGGSVSRSTLRARRSPGGFRLSGLKRPCSLAAEADLVCFQMQVEGEDEVLVALLPTDAPGLTVQRSWDAMGMRGSGSETVRFDDCLVPDELIYYRAPAGQDDDEILAAGVIWFSLTSTACYLGVAQAAMDSARATLAGSRINHLAATRDRLPSYQGAIGDHTGALLTLESACASLAALMGQGGSPQALLPMCLAVKQQAMEVVPNAIAAAIEACGGMAYSRSLPLERLWRDAQAIRFHPPTRASTRQYLGRVALGLPAQLDLDEAAPQLEKLDESGR